MATALSAVGPGPQRGVRPGANRHPGWATAGAPVLWQHRARERGMTPPLLGGGSLAPLALCAPGVCDALRAAWCSMRPRKGRLDSGEPGPLCCSRSHQKDGWRVAQCALCLHDVTPNEPDHLTCTRNSKPASHREQCVDWCPRHQRACTSLRGPARCQTRHTAAHQMTRGQCTHAAPPENYTGPMAAPLGWRMGLWAFNLSAPHLVRCNGNGRRRST